MYGAVAQGVQKVWKEARIVRRENVLSRGL